MQVKDAANADLQSQLSEVQRAHDYLAERLNKKSLALKAVREQCTRLWKAKEQAAEEAACHLRKTIEVYLRCTMCHGFPAGSNRMSCLTADIQHC